MPTYEYSVRIPVSLDTSGVEGQARKFVSQVERMAQQAHARMGGGRAGGNDNAAQRILEQTRRQAEQNERLLERSAKKIADVQAREAKRGANEFLRSMKEMQTGSERTASATSGVFTKVLGAAFFADLASRAVSAFYAKAKEFVGRATELAAETQKAFLSASSKAAQFGISDADTKRTLQNLTLVKSGMVSAGDAAVAYRNLLSRFTPEQSITLLERFADTLAFGKREAISYGEALKAGTQGLKNLESATVDNLGFGKNLSTIMKEQGQKLEDLDDKTKKVKATQSLYNGVLRETAADTGNAAKWAGTYSGAIAQQDVAEQNLQRTIGEFIIQNPAHLEAIRIVTEQITGYTTETGRAGSETEKLANQVLFAWDTIKTNTLPFIAFMTSFGKMLVNALASGLFGVTAVVTKTIETALNGIVDFVKVAINLAIDGINKISSIAKSLPPDITRGPVFGLQSLPTITPFTTGQNPAFLDSDRLFALANEYGAGANTASRGMLAAAREGRAARERLYAASGRTLTPPPAPAAAGGTAGAVTGGESGKKLKKEAEQFSIALVMQALNEFRQQTGIRLPISAQGQSAFHQRRGLDHRNAVDVALNPNSPEGRLLVEFLEAQGVPFLAYTRAVPGQATGPHVHVGHRSRGLGRGVGLTQQRQLDTALALYHSNQALTATGFAPELDPVTGQRTGTFGALRPVETSGDIKTSGLAPRLTSAQEAAAEATARWREQVQQLHDRISNFGQEIEHISRGAYLDFLSRGMNLTVELKDAEERLYYLRKESADDQLTEQRRLLSARQEELSLTERLVQLQDEYANGGLNDGLRAQVAAQEELLALRRADVEAAESQTRSQIRLADATTYHATQANAKVLDFLASQRTVTDVISDAKINVIQSTYDVIDRGLDRMTRKLGVVGSVLKDLISGFIRLALNRAFQSMMLGGGQSGGVASGGGVLSTIGGFLSGLFGGKSTPSTPGWNPTAPMPAAVTGGGYHPMQTANLWSLLANDVGIQAPASLSGGGGLGAAAAGAVNSSSKVGLLQSLGPSLPMMAATISIETFMGALQGRNSDLHNIAGGGLLSFIVGRSARRRREEKIRDQFHVEARTQIYELIAQARRGQLTVEQARTAFNNIRTQYLAAADQLRDSKTRRIARETWNHLQALWPQLEAAAREGEQARAVAAELHPTFAGGGYTGRIPGTFDGRDDRIIRVSGNEVVLNPRQWMPIKPYLQAAGVPGFADGGHVQRQGGAFGVESVSVSVDENFVARVVLRARGFKDEIVKTVRADIRSNPSNIPGDIQEAQRRQRGSN